MFALSIHLLFLSVACTHAIATGCTRDTNGSALCENPDQTTLLQARVHVALQDEQQTDEGEEQTEPFYYDGPEDNSKSLLDYFKHWSKGSIESHLSRIIAASEEMLALEVESSALNAADAGALLSLEMIRGCPGRA
eukprot:CAMPEP_0169378272 /NCGR_PEP_ID=MMETSP1017-20121227/39663_1 /TAXON_ID=342587 /ORGANISM="Karlodinium micrum, Strain CCMP2283" /LENGTH=135 /DNA_ID=CAMNT_0009477467 /DNA_START=54 /DNA_END=457 /DNA_ORIENTATION=+